MESESFTETTLDSALGGRVSVLQPKRGFRFSVDAVLLARFAASFHAKTAVDLGCGSGVVGFCLLALGGCSELIAVEAQACFVELARRGVEVNSFSSARVLACDVREAVRELGRSVADCVVMNPPYRPVASSRVSPDTRSAIARFEVLGGLPDFALCAAGVLRSGGRAFAVYPAGRLDHLLCSLRDAGLTPERLRLIHPRAGEPASLALVGAVKGQAEGILVEPPLVLHEERGSGRKYSEEAASLLGCGEACSA